MICHLISFSVAKEKVYAETVADYLEGDFTHYTLIIFKFLIYLSMVLGLLKLKTRGIGAEPGDILGTAGQRHCIVLCPNEPCIANPTTLCKKKT